MSFDSFGGTPGEEEHLVPWQRGLKLWAMRSPGLEPTVPEGSTLLVHTRWRAIRCGDLVVFKAPYRNLPFLWTMTVRFVPGDVLPECLLQNDRPPEVPQNHYWVQRDGAAHDSRRFGLIHVSAIRGVVIGLLYDGPWISSREPRPRPGLR